MDIDIETITVSLQILSTTYLYSNYYYWYDIMNRTNNGHQKHPRP